MSSSQQSSPLATGIWRTLRRPRVVLALLGGWAALAVVTEFFTSSGLFMDLRGWQIDGALAGRAMSWQGRVVPSLRTAGAPDRFSRRGYLVTRLCQPGPADLPTFIVSWHAPE